MGGIERLSRNSLITSTGADGNVWVVANRDGGGAVGLGGAPTAGCLFCSTSGPTTFGLLIMYERDHPSALTTPAMINPKDRARRKKRTHGIPIIITSAKGILPYSRGWLDVC